MTQNEKKAADKLAAEKLAAEQLAASQTPPAAGDTPPADDKKPEEDKKPDEKTPPAEEIFTSPAMYELNAKRETLEDQLVIAGIKTPDGKKLMLEIWKVDQSIENEITNIKAARKLQEIEERKNARIAMFDNAVEAAIANYVHTTDVLSLIPVGDRTPEQLEVANVIYAKFKTLREAVVNELLAGYKSSTPAKSADGTTTVTGTRGATSKAILELIKPLYEQKVDPAQIRKIVIKDNGFNDGTANGVILAYEKEIGLK